MRWLFVRPFVGRVWSLIAGMLRHGGLMDGGSGSSVRPILAADRGLDGDPEPSAQCVRPAPNNFFHFQNFHHARLLGGRNSRSMIGRQVASIPLWNCYRSWCSSRQHCIEPHTSQFGGICS
jgi:hypothetical protein